MIKAEFYCSDGAFKGFRVSGHSGYSEAGGDIVCASVSSAVMMTCNLVTEIFKIPAETKAMGNAVSLDLKDKDNGAVEGLYRHIKALEEDYPKNITVKVSEV